MGSILTAFYKIVLGSSAMHCIAYRTLTNQFTLGICFRYLMEHFCGTLRQTCQYYQTSTWKYQKVRYHTLKHRAKTFGSFILKTTLCMVLSRCLQFMCGKQQKNENEKKSCDEMLKGIL